MLRVIPRGVKHALLLLSSNDDEEHNSGGGLPSIPEGKEGGPPSPNATVSEGAAIGVAQKASAIQKLSPSKSGKKSGGQSWLTHSDQYALELSQVTDSFSTLGSEARVLDRRLFQTLIAVVKGPSTANCIGGVQCI